MVLFAGLVLVVPDALADSRVPRSRGEITLTFAPIVKRAAPAVVNIYTKKEVANQAARLFNDPFFQQFFGRKLFPNMPRQRVENSLGSGVIVRPDGFVVTNFHVIKGADEIRVVLSDRREFNARLVLNDERTDLAVLRVEDAPQSLPYLDFEDSDELEVGDLVLAIGNPFGVGQTVTSGIVSAIARTNVGISDLNFFIQTDAAINPGNSGGALVSMRGGLVGVNTAIFSRSGGSLGIGFAIPSSMVRRVVASAVSGQPVQRPWIGVTGQTVTNDMAESLGLRRPSGVLVNAVNPRGPAGRAGVGIGDVITEVDGRPIDDPGAMEFRLATRSIGESVTLTYVRDGRARQARFTLVAAPEDPPRDVTRLGGRNPFSGAVVANLNPALAEELNRDKADEGVIVLKLRRGSIADRFGIKPGDMVLEVDGTDVTSVDLLERLLGRNQRQWKISVQRGERVLTEVLRL